MTKCLRWCSWQLYEFSVVAVTNSHKCCCFSNARVSRSSSGGQESETSLMGCSMRVYLPSSPGSLFPRPWSEDNNSTLSPVRVACVFVLCDCLCALNKKNVKTYSIAFISWPSARVNSFLFFFFFLLLRYLLSNSQYRGFQKLAHISTFWSPADQFGLHGPPECGKPKLRCAIGTEYVLDF